MKAKELVEKYNLEPYRYVYLTQSLGTSTVIYLVFYNSRFPTLPISNSQFKNIMLLTVEKISGNSLSPIRFTVPQDIQRKEFTLLSNSIIITIDIAGDWYVTQKKKTIKPKETEKEIKKRKEKELAIKKAKELALKLATKGAGI